MALAPYVVAKQLDYTGQLQASHPVSLVPRPSVHTPS